MTRFDKLDTADIFIAHDRVWVKTSRTAAKSLGPKQSGFCNFMLDGKEEDNFAELVQQLDSVEVSTLLYKHFT